MHVIHTMRACYVNVMMLAVTVRKRTLQYIAPFHSLWCHFARRIKGCDKAKVASECIPEQYYCFGYALRSKVVQKEKC